MGISAEVRKLRQEMMRESAKVMAITAFQITYGDLDPSLIDGLLPVPFRAIRVYYGQAKKQELYRDGTSIEISGGGKTIFLTLKEEEILQGLIQESLKALWNRQVVKKTKE